MPHRAALRPLFTALLIGALGLLVRPSGAAERAVLQLKWRHQFQFAGYYLAAERGYYRDAGLEVELREAAPDLDVTEEVLAGRADFGVGTSDIVVRRAEGAPLVALAVVFQHSPLGLLVRRDSGIDNVHQLSGRRVMIEPGSSELFALLKREHVDVASLRQQPHRLNADGLLSRTVEAMSVYVTDEPYTLEKQGVAFNVFTGRQGGIDFYGDNLFTLEPTARRSPSYVERFRDASLRGWRDAFANPAAAVDLILARYPSGKGREQLLFEAHATEQLAMPTVVEVGYMNPGRWQHIADTYVELGMLPRGAVVEGLMFSATRAPLPTWVRWTLGVGAAALVIVTAFGIALARSARRLRKALAELHTLQGILPICMHCKKIRDGEGAWQPLEAYIEGRSKASFTHGLCPTCIEAHYPEEEGGAV